MTNNKSTFINESNSWWLQRALSILLIPLFIWLTLTIISFIITSPTEGITFSQIIQYIGLGSEKYVLVLFSIIALLHISLGIEEVIEDYVHTEKAKLVSSVLLKILIIRLMNEAYIFYIG